MGLFDLHLLVQALLYFGAFMAGFVISIPIGVTMINFDGMCILYATYNWPNKTHFVMMSSSHGNCNAPIYLGVFGCIFYGLGMGIYNLYATYKSRADPTTGSQMWVMPFILTNSLLAVSVFIISCIVSVGFSQFCNGMMATGRIKNCADQQNKKWKNVNDGSVFNTGNFYKFMTVAQTACWICFLIWTCQVVCGILRFVRNRRARSRGDRQLSDTANIGHVNPSA